MTIPADVTYINLSPFGPGTSIAEITCLATTPPALHYAAFIQLTLGDITLYVPDESVELYKAAPVWKDFEMKPPAGTGVKEVREVRDDTWYTLDGRKLDGKPRTKGIYINGGRKVVNK